MNYSIAIHSKAKKILLTLPVKAQRKITRIIDSLAENSRPDGCRQLSDKYDDIYRLRSGDYRIVYQIKEAILLVYVIRVGQRGDIYQGDISSRRK